MGRTGSYTAAQMTNSNLTGSVCICEAATCVITNNPAMSKDSWCVLVCVNVYIILRGSVDIRPRDRCLMPAGGHL